MALAAVKMTDTAPAVSLSERIAEAQRAEVRPRNRVAELEGQFDQALASKKYADADRLQGELQPARTALVMAEAMTRGLREGQALADAQRAEEQRAVQQAHAQDEARRIAGDAVEAERQAMDAIEESLAQLWATIGAAQDCYRQALALETKVWQERERAYRAHVTLGERPDGMRIQKPNHATVLVDRDPLVAALARWSGPERRTPPPVFVAEGRGVGAAARTRQAPW